VDHLVASASRQRQCLPRRSPQDEATAEFREIATLYRTAPDEALSQLLLLLPARRDTAIAAAAKADWPWDDLAAAAMLETDAALAHLRRDDSASAPHLDAAERLLLRGLQVAPEQIAFVTRWYRGVADTDTYVQLLGEYRQGDAERPIARCMTPEDVQYDPSRIPAPAI
jgi:hypothetical protein